VVLVGTLPYRTWPDPHDACLDIAMITVAPENQGAVPIPAAFDMVAIAASLGGMRALGAVLSNLPRDFPAPIVVVQHRHPALRSTLAELLRQRTDLPVQEARAGDRLRAGTVFVAPRDRHLLVTATGHLDLWDTPKVQFSRPAADVLFRSVAEHHRERAIGVVLTGRLHDGAAGVTAIKQAGGWVLAQDPTTAEAKGMPSAAAATGCVDFVLSLTGLASALVALVTVPGAAAFFRRPPAGLGARVA
jgi:two-component system chemotaxis response regulator CheB